MSDATRADFLDRIRKGRARSRTLPSACYREPTFFELELEHVLRPGWHAVARWDELPEPGDYAAIDHCGEPLLIVRDAERVLRVYSRACRHRAHPVVEGSGNARRFVCPYHRWSYGLDGSLETAPLMDGVAGFDRSRCGLPEVRTDTWMGFLFVNLDPEAPPVATGLEPLEERMRPLGLAEMVSLGVLDFGSPWNWKVMVDNFMESYHHMGAHRETLQRTNPAKGTYCADLDGPFALLENPGVNGAPGFVVAQVFPTLLFFAQEATPVGGWYEMQIDRHDHLRLRIHSLASKEIAATPGMARGIEDFVLKVHLEDIAVCEAVQRGLSSRLWEPGPLSVQEACLARFHRYLEERLA